MTERLKQKMQDGGINLNTGLLVVSLIGAITTTIFFFAPLKTLPTDMEKVQQDMDYLQQMQAVQTEALKALAELTADTKETRREFDRHSAKVNADIHSIFFRLEKLEK